VAMAQSDLLNGRPNFHLFLNRPLLPQGPVETGPADSGQLTQASLPDDQASERFAGKLRMAPAKAMRAPASNNRSTPITIPTKKVLATGQFAKM